MKKILVISSCVLLMLTSFGCKQKVGSTVKKEVTFQGKTETVKFVYSDFELYDYDQYGDLIREQTAGEINQYGLEDKIVKHTDLYTGDITRYKYDENGNVIRVVTTDKKSKKVKVEKTYLYDEKSNLLNVTRTEIYSDGTYVSAQNYLYDSQGNNIYERDVQIAVNMCRITETRKKYDASGNLTYEKFSKLPSMNYEGDSYLTTKGSYDNGYEKWYNAGQIAREKYDSGYEVRYDSHGNTIYKKSADGEETRNEYEYDSHGNIINSKDYNSEQLKSYEYYPDGKIKTEYTSAKIFDYGSGTSTIYYDENGNIIHAIYMNGESWNEYDDHGNLIHSKTVFNGDGINEILIEYEYLPDGKVKSKKTFTRNTSI